MPNRALAEDPDSRRFAEFARTRDAAVLDKLIAEHLDRAYAQARALLGNNAEAEDAVQDAFLRLVRSATTYDGTVPFGAWLGRLVHNAAIDTVRSRNRRKRREARAAAEQNDRHDTCDLESEAVRAAVQDLPERYRATVDLHYFAGLSQCDTAKALGMQENAVAKRLERAREYLRSLLLRRGVAVSGAAIVAALAAPSAYAAPATLLNSVQAASLVLTGTSASASVATVSSALFSVKTVALIALGLGMAGGAAWMAAKHGSDRSVRTWDFNTGSSEGITVLGGKWHPAPGLGPDGSTCMEMDQVESLLALDYALEDSPVLLTWDSQPIASPPADGFTTTVKVSFDLGAMLWNIGPARDLRHEWESYRCYLSHDRVDIWCGSERANFMWLSKGHGQICLRLRGIYRIDQIEVRRIGKEALPDASRLISAIENLAPSLRRGVVRLPQVTSFRPPAPVVARFIDGTVPADASTDSAAKP